jgi:hypothetical protein
MCCSNPRQLPGRFSMGIHSAPCGCGCIGREQSVCYLENYKAYLEAELASVERQIVAIQHTKP